MVYHLGSINMEAENSPLENLVKELDCRVQVQRVSVLSVVRNIWKRRVQQCIS